MGIKSLALFFLLFFAMFFEVAARNDPKVIYHSAQNKQKIPEKLLLKIYAMQVKNWPDGTAIKVFILPNNNPTHKNFVIRYFKMPPHQLVRLWKRLIFSGTGRGPIKVNSEAEMIAKVSNTKGAIGYVSDLTVINNNSINIVDVNHE